MTNQHRNQRINNAHDQDRTTGIPHTAEQAAEALQSSHQDMIDYAVEQFVALGMAPEEIEEELREMRENF